MSASTRDFRWTGPCQGCGSERELIGTRYSHVARALCEECASRPHKPPSAGDSEFDRCRRPFDRPLDRLLLALRATRQDSYRPDERRMDTWRAFCPACAGTVAGDRRELTIVERRVGGPVTVGCRNRCATTAVYAALDAAEAAFNASRCWEAA